MSKADLSEVIQTVEAHLQALPEITADSDYAARQAYWRGADYALDRLAVDHGAKVGQSGDARSLQIGGVRTSSTGGAAQVMRNWLNAARRKLAAAPPP